MVSQLTWFGDEEPIGKPAKALKLRRDHHAILRALDRADLTDDELCLYVGRNGNSVRPRRGELVEAGLVYAAGQTRSASGRPMTRWGITEKGREVLAGDE